MYNQFILLKISTTAGIQRSARKFGKELDQMQMTVELIQKLKFAISEIFWENQCDFQNVQNCMQQTLIKIFLKINDIISKMFINISKSQGR